MDNTLGETARIGNHENLSDQYMDLEILKRAPRSEEIMTKDFSSDFSVTYFLKNKGDYIWINIESGEIQYRIHPSVEAKKITDKSQAIYSNLFNSAKKDFNNSCFGNILPSLRQKPKEEIKTRKPSCLIM